MLKNNYNLGLVLSGGGVRGFAHLGVLKALNEKGVFPDVISGVSAGSIVGAFYASGYKPDDILKIFVEQKIFGLFGLTLPKYGFFKFTGLEKVLISHLSVDKIEDLKIPLVICSSNLSKACPEYFENGKLIRSILASSCIPIIFNPIAMNESSYVDGAVFDNFPISPLLGKCKKIIGVYVNHVKQHNSFHSLFEISDRVFTLTGIEHVNQSIDKCNLYISPESLCNYGSLDFSKSKEIFDIGYKEAKKMLTNEVIKGLL